MSKEEAKPRKTTASNIHEPAAPAAASATGSASGSGAKQNPFKEALKSHLNESEPLHLSASEKLEAARTSGKRDNVEEEGKRVEDRADFEE